MVSEEERAGSSGALGGACHGRASLLLHSSVAVCFNNGCSVVCKDSKLCFTLKVVYDMA